MRELPNIIQKLPDLQRRPPEATLVVRDEKAPDLAGVIDTELIHRPEIYLLIIHTNLVLPVSPNGNLSNKVQRVPVLNSTSP